MLVSSPAVLMAPTSERLTGVLRGTLRSTRRTPFGSASVAPRHVQVTARLVQKDQPPRTRIYLAHALAEGTAFLLVGFAGHERLFLRGSPSVSMTR